MTEHFAKAYAAYISGWGGKNVLSMWMPFFAQILLDKNSDVLDVSVLRDELKSRYGIKMPLDIIRQVLETVNQDRRFLSLSRQKVSCIDKAVLASLVNPSQDYMARWQEIGRRFEIFCRKVKYPLPTDWCKLSDIILDCIERFDVQTVARDQNLMKPIEPGVVYVWSCFILELKEADRELYAFICSLCYGSIAQELLFYRQETNLVFRGLDVFIDTPLIFQLLGICDEEEHESADFLIKGLLKSGCNVRVFRHTLEEAIGIAGSSKRWALDAYGYKVDLASKTCRFFRSRCLNEQEIDEYICDIEGDLKKRYEIGVMNSSYKWEGHQYQESHAELVSLFREWSVDRDDGVDEGLDIDRRIDADVHSVELLYRLRAGLAPKNFQRCRIIMVTPSRMMASVCKTYERRNLARLDTIPVCITSKLLASLLWMSNVQEMQQYKRLELLADCARFIKPSQDMIVKFMSKLRALNENEGDYREKFFVLTTSPLMERVLMSETRGEVDNITENTVDAVFERVRASIVNKEKSRVDANIACHKARREKIRKLRENRRLNILTKFSTFCVWGGVHLVCGTGLFFYNRYIDTSKYGWAVLLFIIESVSLAGWIHERWGSHLGARIARWMFGRIPRHFIR